MDTLARLESGQLAGITRLDLSCGLKEFPPAIFELADSLEVLNLSGNALHCLPDDLHRLHKLQVLFCSDNQFTELPACIGRCTALTMVGFKANSIEHVPAEALPPKLRWLILTDNCIAQLPDALGNCTALQKLMLAGNRLRELPASLARCKQLELLRISANQLPALPKWLFAMPRLAWLAYGANPLAEGFRGAQQTTTTTAIPWAELEIHEMLGQGASGVIHRARWRGQAEVAVKLYKGEITSDGSPLSEMEACLQAGQQTNLIGLRGQVFDHPQGVKGLVMDLIDPAFLNLAGPPSLQSCTRDIYPAGTRLSHKALHKMIAAVAAVGAHLHGQGILHGDLYAHNILWQPSGECLLGDFGAASFYPAVDTTITRALERLEVRAFGILLGELLALCDVTDAELLALQARCEQPEVDARPSFAQIVQQL